MSETTEGLNTQDEVYTLKLTEWDRNAIHTIINNGNFTGKDVVQVAKLLQKVQELKKE